jgi:hypothetical protein
MDRVTPIEAAPGQPAGVITAISALADDLDHDEIAAIPPPKQGIRPLTAILLALLLGGATFYAGVHLEKSRSKSSTGAIPASFAALARTGGTTTPTTGRAAGTASGGQAGAAAGGQAGAAGGGATIGTVKIVDGTHVYVTDLQTSQIIKVTTGADSKITISQSGKPSDLRPGDTVIISGAKDATGAIKATSIIDNGSGGASGGLPGGGFPGGGFPGGALPGGAPSGAVGGGGG